ncbi:MAG: serine/threonine-protein kinase, partial [Patescibacteria group bacterium]
KEQAMKTYLEPTVRNLMAAVAGLQKEKHETELYELIEMARDGNGMEQNEAVAYAHIACASANGRHWIPAVQRLEASHLYQEIFDLQQLLKLYKEFTAIMDIRRVGFVNNRSELFCHWMVGWFFLEGVFWFPYYRDADTGFSYIKPEDFRVMHQLAQDGVTGSYGDTEIPNNLNEYWENVLARVVEIPGYPAERIDLLRKISQAEEPKVPMNTTSDRGSDPAESFFDFCDQQQIEDIRCLQQGRDGLNRCSWVFLARDSDGIVKVFKEVLEYHGDRFADLVDDEARVHEHLAGAPGWVNYYGVVNAGSYRFLKMPYLFGKQLSEILAGSLEKDQAIWIALQIAIAIRAAHARGVIDLDVRPEHVMIDGAQVTMFDLSTAKRVERQGAKIPTYPFVPRYVAPEVVMTGHASEKTDVFSLGVLLYQMLTGNHPFELCKELDDDLEHRESQLLKYGMACAFMPLRSEAFARYDDPRLECLASMLSKNPDDRPTMRDVERCLEKGTRPVSLQVAKKMERKREKNTVLFPARMGIPHKGHIEYISRLLDVGYHVLISVQRAYTITDRDPIEKVLVAKMVAQSLFARGYTLDDFTIMLTPFFRTDQEHRMHFAVMPGRENVIAIASSNPTAAELLSVPLIDQKAVFGEQGQDYNDLSWGEILRKAVRDGDRETFEQYSATGVECVLSFGELREQYAHTPVEFVEGNVVAFIRHDGDLYRTVVRRFSLPEEQFCNLLREQGHEVILVGLFEPVAILLIDGQRYGIRFDHSELHENEKHLVYECVPA